MSFLGALHNAMATRGFFIVGEVDLNKIGFQRFRDAKGKSRKANMFVSVHNGGASFGDWRHPEGWITWWEKGFRELSFYDKQKRVEEIERLKYEAEERRQYSRARAILLWNHRASKAASRSHPYVKKKKIIPYQAKQIRGTLMIKVVDINEELQTLQFIKPNGFKKFKKSASAQGGMVWLWHEKLSLNYEGVIRICEGWSTGCTIARITRSPVVCAMSAGNLTDTAINLRRKFAFANIKLCADNDQWNDENTGLLYGREAALHAGISLHYPDFINLDVRSKPTDFNDLFILSSAENVKRQLILNRR